jgi:hypothetical protein
MGQDTYLKSCKILSLVALLERVFAETPSHGM